MSTARTVADTGARLTVTTPRKAGTARPIDLAYGEINALGGDFDPRFEVMAAREKLLGEVLDILERFGAVDPDLASVIVAECRSAA